MEFSERKEMVKQLVLTDHLHAGSDRGAELNKPKKLWVNSSHY